MNNQTQENNLLSKVVENEFNYYRKLQQKNLIDMNNCNKKAYSLQADGEYINA